MKIIDIFICTKRRSVKEKNAQNGKEVNANVEIKYKIYFDLRIQDMHPGKRYPYFPEINLMSHPSPILISKSNGTDALMT